MFELQSEHMLTIIVNSGGKNNQEIQASVF